MQAYGAKTFKESPRVSLSCGVPLSMLDQISSRKSVSYKKLPQVPIKLTVVKLNGTSFEIYVAKNGTVAELKKAVEAAFSHLPKNGPGTVSWLHVWGWFCLSYDGEKLLTDSCSIGNYGIKDGARLEFVRHVSVNYPAKMRSERVRTGLDEASVYKGNGDMLSKCKEDKNMGKRESNRVTVVSNCQCSSSAMSPGKWFSRPRISTSVVPKRRPSNA